MSKKPKIENQNPDAESQTDETAEQDPQNPENPPKEPWIKRTKNKVVEGAKKHKKAIVTVVATVGGVFGALLTLNELAKRDSSEDAQYEELPEYASDCDSIESDPDGTEDTTVTE